MWFFGLIVVVLIGAVAVVASGRWGAMSTAYDDRPDMTVPARQVLTSTDIESARFAVGVRGYRMDEVDTLLERVAKEVAERDRRIADLERAVAPIVDTPDGAGFSSKSPYDASDFEDTGPHQPILVGGDFPVSKPADDKPADSTAEVPQVAVPAAPAEPTPPAAEPKAESGAAAEVADDDEPETSELPRTRQAAAADEYERLQAEARAVLEAQSQPVTPRRTPAAPHSAPAQQQPQDEQPPQASSQPSADTQLAAAEQPAPTLHWTQAPEPQQQFPEQQAADVQQPQAEQSAPATHWTQAPPPQQQSDPEQGNGQQGEGEGWRFWPPADQEGEGAYQRPS